MADGLLPSYSGEDGTERVWRRYPSAAMRGILVSDPEETRTIAEIREHYEIETALAARLREASREERRALYASVYDELFQRVASHPLLVQKGNNAPKVASQLPRFARYLHPGAVFLEVGAGDCALASAVARKVRKAYALDVSEEIMAGENRPENLSTVVTDGIDVPVPPESVTIAYSNQLFEHLHPEDAFDHLRQIHSALSPGGRYVCVTPNRLTGPHDVSKHFDLVATGLHLREYSLCELGELMRRAGFGKAEAWTTRKGVSVRLPWATVRAAERLVGRLPSRLRRTAGEGLPARILLEGFVVGVKTARLGDS